MNVAGHGAMEQCVCVITTHDRRGKAADTGHATESVSAGQMCLSTNDLAGLPWGPGWCCACQLTECMTRSVIIHLYSSETLIAQKKKKKTITIRTRKASKHQQAKRSETIINKTEVRLTISYNLYVICSEHHEKSAYNEILRTELRLD